MDIALGAIVLVCGSIKSGKTNLIKCLLASNWRRFNTGLVMCPPGSEEDYTSWLPAKWIPEWGSAEERVQRLVNTQLSNPQRKAFLILDDCVGSVRFESAFWTGLFIRSRHLRLTIFVVTQYIAKLSLPIRENTSQAFIFSCRTKRAFVLLWESFGQQFERWEKFRDFIQEHTERPFSCVRYDRDTQRYTRYRAPDMSESRFRIKG